MIYAAKFVQNSPVTLHAPGDLGRASLHQSESWIVAREDFRTADNHFMEKERNRWRNFFCSSRNAILSILVKYKEIDLQIQTLADQN